MNGRKALVSIPGWFAGLMLAQAVHATQVAAVEFFDLAHDRYLITASPAEIGALGSGALGSFYRSGTAYVVDDAPGAGLAPVCRFATHAGGVAAHLYTASASECEALKTDPSVTYEGIAFYSPVPDAAGNCAANTSPVYRLSSSTYDGVPMLVYTPYPDRMTHLQTLGFQVVRVEYCVPTSMDIAKSNTMLVDNSYWRLTGWWPGPVPFYPNTDAGTPIGLYFAGTTRSREPADADREMSDFLTSAFPYFIYRSGDYYFGPLDQVLAWGPFANEYEVIQLQFNESSKTGDIIGGAYSIVWTGGEDAQACSRQVLINRGAGATGLEVDPLQPILIVNRFVVCGPATKSPLPNSTSSPQYMSPRGPPLAMTPS